MKDPRWGDKETETAREFFGLLWRAGREAATKKKQVVEAVRASCEGMSRDERRVLFERELDRHGAPRDPIWVERELDELELTPGERPLKRAKDVVLAATALRHVARGFSDLPAWMNLPEDVGRSAWARRSEKTTVGIELGAEVLLERALAEAPHRIGNEAALFDVWFDWKPGMDAEQPIAVYLGEHRIGVLDAKATHRLAVALGATRFVQPKPFAKAHLARAKHLQPPYLLVVEIPVPESAVARG
jgi:hypothetical protein